MADIAQEFQSNYSKFEATARDWTEKFATKVRHLGSRYNQAYLFVDLIQILLMIYEVPMIKAA